MSELIYNFGKLKRCVEIIKAQHPRASEPITSIHQDDLSSLIKRIVSAEERAWPDVAIALTKHEATLLIHAYQRKLSDHHYNAITQVLSLRPVIRQLPQAWSILRNHPDLKPLIVAMGTITKAITLPESNQDMALEKLHLIWSADDIYGYLVTDLNSTKLPLDQWSHGAWSPDQRPDESFPIYHRIQAEILTRGSRDLLIRHPKHEIASWFDFVPESSYDDAAVNYINQLNEKEWNLTIIEQLVERHGLPAAMGTFWSRVDKKKRLIIQRLIGAKLIGDFFADVCDPEGRFEFWRGYVDHLAGIAFPQSRQRVLLVFSRALVVEFRDLGNAVYFYQTSDRDWVERAVTSTSPNTACKDKTRCITKVNHSQNWRVRMRNTLQRIV